MEYNGSLNLNNNNNLLFSGDPEQKHWLIVFCVSSGPLHLNIYCNTRFPLAHSQFNVVLLIPYVYNYHNYQTGDSLIRNDEI